MNSIEIEKRRYEKPQLNLVAIDFSISLYPGSLPGLPGGFGAQKNESSAASSKNKTTTPFGGSKPNYK